VVAHTEVVEDPVVAEEEVNHKIYCFNHVIIMKKKLLISLLFSGITLLQAQDISDAVRYSQDNLSGTARFRAMGGAFGALGGDFSALSVNPAGSAIFTTNQATVTLSSINNKNRSGYFGTKTSENDNSFDLNQAGAVWQFDLNAATSDWKKVTLALNYENANNFDNSVFSAGINPTNSVANYFISNANGIPLNILTSSNYEFLDFREQQAYLGYRGLIINPISGSGNQYTSSISGNSNYYQENSITSNGFNGKLSFNAAASYKDRLYVGVNLNSHFTDYTRNTSFYEDYLNTPGHDASTGVQSLRFNNDIYTYGSGFSFQLGAIAKVTDAFRVGLSYESPTWYELNDELLQTLRVSSVERGNFRADQNLVIVYPTYRLTTPGKYNGSLAYIFGKKGLISFDYSLKDYTNARLRPESDPQFNAVNNEINNELTASNEFRVGAEYRLNQFSIRSGYRFEESPYRNGNTIGDLTSYSAGLGYDFGRTKVDLAYAYAKRDYNQGIFSTGLTNAPAIENTNNTISLTVAFEL
jgi:hypothetical protein